MNVSGRRPALALLVAAVALGGGTAHAAPPTTVDRTIVDRDNDNLLEFGPGERHMLVGGEAFDVTTATSVLNFLHLTDFQIIDEESPARVEFLDATQGSADEGTTDEPGEDPNSDDEGPESTSFSAAYRPQEALTAQVQEAMVRAVRKLASPFSGKRPRLTILTGDNADSQQYNETRWFIDILDGGVTVDPDSGQPDAICPHTSQGSEYDGVEGDGEFYDPDASGEPMTDGAGYSPDRAENEAATGRDVTVRDFPGLLDAANRPFEAAGLRMPWYSAFGNHDALIQGNNPDAYLGPYGPGPLDAADAAVETFHAHPFHDAAISCAKGTDEGPEALLAEPESAVIVPPDVRRCFLAKDDVVVGPPGTPCEDTSWIGQHFVTGGTPDGHGFAPPANDEDVRLGYGRPFIADANNDGYYSFSPVRGIRFVVLDSVTDECGHTFCSEGSIDDPQFRWLENQIQLADEHGQHVLVFAHHTLKTTRAQSIDVTEYPLHFGRVAAHEPQDIPTQIPLGKTLKQLFCESDNVLAMVDGHEHENAVRRQSCPGGDAFWEIVTAGHIDWPQQSRMIEILVDGDGTIGLGLTTIDHAGPPRPSWGEPKSGLNRVPQLASVGRELTYNDHQGKRSARGDREDRNVIIALDRTWPYTRPSKAP